MKASESIAALAAALSKAQSVIETAFKDKANPHFKSRYVDLAGVWDVIREPMTANGLSIVQMPDVWEGEPVLVTRLLHSSGEWLEGTYPLIPVKKDPQGYASSITYARRYAVMGVLGVCPSDDDDGNAASGRSAVPVIKDDVKPKAAAIPADLKAEADNLRSLIDASTGEIALKLIMKNSKGLLDRLGQHSPSAVKWLEQHAEKHLASFYPED